jgi:two-component system, NtrC family, response regulator AtoC
MAPLRQTVKKILSTDIPVLITGPNGSGKGLLARYIHSHSLFLCGSFVKVNCAAIPGALLETELFGYEQGAFTGAHRSKAGYVEMANRGTLFLDEIADLDLNLQAKLLHLLQDGRFSRIGGSEERRAELRVICAANRSLEAEVRSARFRPDLYYRINVIDIRLPSLNERREDIVPLANYFLGKSNAQFETKTPPIPPEMIDKIVRLDWRGNIRELENLVARYAILGSVDGAINLPSNGLHSKVTKPASSATIPLKRIAKQAVRQMETSVILQVLRDTKWNRRKAAQILDISYRALIYKIQEAGLSQKRGRKQGESDLLPIRESSST